MLRGLLLDVAGKQRYIFGSNKLKVNIGASNIIADKLFGEELTDCLESTCEDGEYEIINTYGGNSMIFFRSKIPQVNFLKKYSSRVLQEYPGVELEVGVADFVADESFKSKREKLFLDKSRRRNERFYTKEIDIGIARNGSILGKPASKEVERLKWVSGETYKKWNSDSFSKIDGLDQSRFTQTSIVKEISPEDHKSFIAVVHIDGNRMGQEFLNIEHKDEFKEKSTKRQKELDLCLSEVVQYLQSIVDTKGYISCGQDKDTYLSLHKNALGKYTLPFRSIINAGDDITFVCHGKLGILLAQRYLEALNSKGISAAAGVAIVHTPHPFYKAYELAEALCRNCKAYSMEDNETRIQYMVCKNGISGDYEQMVEQEFSGYGVQLKAEPWKLDEFQNICTQAKHLKDNWPKNQYQLLMQSLHSSTLELDFLIDVLNKRNLTFKDNQIPSVQELAEIADLLEFYPLSLNENATNHKT